jgi:hypothetical protein
MHQPVQCRHRDEREDRGLESDKQQDRAKKVRVRSPYERGSRVFFGKDCRHWAKRGSLVGILILIVHGDFLVDDAKLPGRY